MYDKKIIALSNLEETVRRDNFSGKAIVLAGGCFDIFHYGHFIYLTKAKQEGEILMVLLEPDEFIKVRKSKVPIHTQTQRAHILAALEFVDYVVLLPHHLKSYEEYLEVIKKIRPKVIAVTEGDTYLDLKQKQAQHVGATIKEVTSQIGEFSSTNIRKLYETFSGN